MSVNHLTKVRIFTAFQNIPEKDDIQNVQPNSEEIKIVKWNTKKIIKEVRIKKESIILIHGNKKSCLLCLVSKVEKLLQSKDSKVQHWTIKLTLNNKVLHLRFLMQRPMSKFHAIELIQQTSDDLWPKFIDGKKMCYIEA